MGHPSTCCSKCYGTRRSVSMIVLKINDGNLRIAKSIPSCHCYQPEGHMFYARISDYHTEIVPSFDDQLFKLPKQYWNRVIDVKGCSIFAFTYFTRNLQSAHRKKSSAATFQTTSTMSQK